MASFNVTRTATLPDSSQKTDFYNLVSTSTVTVTNLPDTDLQTISTSGKVAAGALPLAVAADLNTGTETTKVVTPDALAGSNTGTRLVILKVIADDDTLATGDGQMYFTVPPELNGMNLVDVDAHVYTVSSSGTPTVQIYNLTDTADMLSTRITIDANEKDSSTAATQPVIDTARDDIATADELRVDVDVAGTGTKGLEVRLSFRLP